MFTRLRVASGNLRAHKLNHNFSDCAHEFCICGILNFACLPPMSIFFYPKEKPLWRKSVNLRFFFPIKMKILFFTFYYLVAINLMTLKTFCIFNATIEYILSTERFNITLCKTKVHNNLWDDCLKYLYKKLISS